ncbi:hypothetical protein ACFFRR_004595 [Megaselia abdita]
MFKTHKSFNLENKEAKDNKTVVEKKYKTPEKKCHWMRYLFIPGICLLVILLIVPNIHSKEYYEMRHTKITVHNTNITNKSYPINLSVKQILKNTSMAKRPMMTFDDLQSSCLKQGCVIVCSNIEASFEKLSSYFEGCPQIENLTIINGIFPNNVIPSDWLENDSHQIMNLFIEDSYITKIEENAFRGKVLRNFQKLWIFGSSIKDIHQKAFFTPTQSLSEKSFKLENNASSSFSIEIGKSFFPYLQGKLKELVLYNPSAQSESLYRDFWIWFSGADEYSILETLDLSHNYFLLSQADFKYFPKLETLILRNCGLKTFPLSAFSIENVVLDMIKGISVINIQNNQLETLETKLLKVFLENEDFEKFYISGNPWICGGKDGIDVWYRKYSEKFEEGVLCGDGSRMDGTTSSPPTITSTTPTPCSKQGCDIVCSNIDATFESLSTYFQGCPLVQNLTIINGIFPNNKIPMDWLENDSYQIVNLFIKDSFITHIRNNAFSGRVFKDFQKIWIFGSSIEEIHKDSFFYRGQDQNEKSFKIENNATRIFSIDNGNSFFTYLQDNLKEVAINNPSIESSLAEPFSKWFDGINFKPSYKILKILDLSHNHLSLSPNDFKRFPKLETLILRKTRLEKLPFSAFSSDNFDKISVINIQDNRLETLEPQLIQKFMMNNNFEKFYISGNPWKCGETDDIDFWYRNFTDKFEKDVLCGDGSPMIGQTTMPPTTTASTTTPVKITDEISSSTPVTITTEISTTTVKQITPDSPSDEINLNCTKQSSDKPFIPVSIADKVGDFHFISFDQRTVKVVISKIPLGYSLMWYHLESPKDKVPVIQSGPGHNECDCDVSVLIEGLVPKQAYTFCLIGYNDSETSPLNCRSYYTGDDDPDIWLTKDAKAAVLSILILGLFLMFAIGSIAMYFTIRRYPRIAKGRRIVVANDNNSSVLIMPRKSCHSSVKKPQTRRKSDVSIGSGKTYFIPDTFDSQEYEMIRETIYFDEFPTSPPPPLPKRLSRQSTINKDDLENNYLKTIDENGTDNF